MSNREQFTNRWGIILAALGMAIGAGNLWRFPRLAGQYGGSFIIMWIIFLIIWSIPLLLAEFAIGKKFKKGVLASFSLFAGKRLTWMGFFVTICTLGIAFYYSIVTAWSLEYLAISVIDLFQSESLSERLAQNPKLLDEQWQYLSNNNFITVGCYIFIVVLAAFVLSKSIDKGLEKVNRILIPSLFVLLIIIAFVALNLPNGMRGLSYMFEINVDLFYEPVVWIEALSQSAWSTGAGWGLMLTLSAYSRDKEDVTLNTFIGGFGNNTASLLAGMAILPAVFGLAASDAEAIGFLQAGNQSLTFTIIPKLFSQISGGGIFAVVFFLALFFAAFSSLLPMVELFISNLTVFGYKREQVKGFVIGAFIIFGFPSAYNLDFFSNQDWVWGIGLILSGLFFLIAVAKYGPKRFQTDFMDEDADIKIPKIYFSTFIYLNIFTAVFLIYWWMSRGYSEYPWFNAKGQWNLFDVYSNASIVTQWLIVLAIGLLLNKFLTKKLYKK